MADDWRDVLRLCDDLRSRLPDIADRSTTRIRREIAAYGSVPRREHVVAVAQQQALLVKAIERRASLGEDDLEQAVLLAHRRASQDIAIEMLIDAYHIGDNELWTEFRRSAAGSGTYLPEIASLIMESMHAVSSVLASAHSEVTQSQRSHRITLSQRFVELVASRDRTAEAGRVAVALGFGLDAQFTAAVWPSSATPEPEHGSLSRVLERRPGVIASGHVDRHQIVVAQGPSSRFLHSDLSGVVSAAGIGLSRGGVEGAVLSVTDARLALRAAEMTGGIARFSDVWYDASVLSQLHIAEPLLKPTISTAVENQSLAATVLAFAAADMSIADTARMLHLHANTVTYRLERWKQLTAWNPRTFAGLRVSELACRLASRCKGSETAAVQARLGS